MEVSHWGAQQFWWSFPNPELHRALVCRTLDKTTTEIPWGQEAKEQGRQKRDNKSKCTCVTM